MDVAQWWVLTCYMQGKSLRSTPGHSRRRKKRRRERKKKRRKKTRQEKSRKRRKKRKRRRKKRGRNQDALDLCEVASPFQ